ncbi:MAG: hypothetical protein E5Y10_24865 [Mesorhizobium sp.]|nr:MAG: hypothetical protein EOR98_23050 [Mesorhizobium sp.]RWN75802.1 MAG: hypothetical protein EOS01_22110 [Mesorhizobium sp.]RWN77169.1 MAG: hypothetical protein EOS02_11580 [Mesorhizobium sp.]RWN87059.1 MAG: hypothetical protein EOS04_17305 [Mesorhizobium sp.]RWO00003.1 MAG: hypothetical protein EOS06_15770 [Mesorhizobium sp.]
MAPRQATPSCPSPLPSPREGRGEGDASVAASSLLPVTIRGEGAGRRMRGGAACQTINSQHQNGSQSSASARTV